MGSIISCLYNDILIGCYSVHNMRKQFHSIFAVIDLKKTVLRGRLYKVSDVDALYHGYDALFHYIIAQQLNQC